MLPTLRINKVVFLENHLRERYAWYLTIVHIAFKPCCFWSAHKCTGMNDEEAARAFRREHFQEVEVLVSQKIKNELKSVNN